MTKRDPRHRRRQIMRVGREISLPRSCRRDIDIGCLFRSQSITKRIEDLPLTESSDTGGVIGGEVFGAGFEWTHLERRGRVGDAGQKPRVDWARNSRAVTVGATMVEYQLPPK